MAVVASVAWKREQHEGLEGASDEKADGKGRGARCLGERQRVLLVAVCRGDHVSAGGVGDGGRARR